MTILFSKKQSGLKKAYRIEYDSTLNARVIQGYSLDSFNRKACKTKVIKVFCAACGQWVKPSSIRSRTCPLCKSKSFVYEGFTQEELIDIELSIKENNAYAKLLA